MNTSNSHSDLHLNRLKLIEHKIQAISDQKETAAKNKVTQRIADRVLQLESTYQLHTNSISQRVQELTQSLTTARIQQGELNKRCQAASQSRRAQIVELRAQVRHFLNDEPLQRKESEQQRAADLEEGIRRTALEISRIQKQRKEEIDRLESQLQQALPQTQHQIDHTMSQGEVSTLRLHEQIHRLSGLIRHKLANEQTNWTKAVESADQMERKAIEEVKAEIAKERQAREGARIQLLSLVEQAVGKIQG